MNWLKFIELANFQYNYIYEMKGHSVRMLYNTIQYNMCMTVLVTDSEDNLKMVLYQFTTSHKEINFAISIQKMLRQITKNRKQ